LPPAHVGWLVKVAVPREDYLFVSSSGVRVVALGTVQSGFPRTDVADIAITVERGVQIIRFQRAAKKNAFTRSMYAAIVAALAHADVSDEIGVTVFFGAPGAFSAGNDMTDFAARAQGKIEVDRPGSMSAGRMIQALPAAKKPLIAAVDGLAIGVGVTLLLHCDLVFAAPNATFTTPFLNLGLVPEAASSLIGPQRLSYVRAFELLVLGETWSADQALAAGLINAVVAPAELEARALKAADALVAKPRAALIEARRLLKGDMAPVVAMMAAESAAYEVLLPSPEAREAFAAFVEKRSPDFALARAKPKP
jgi:enoyl-CoA hydratase/carnithine racemase